MKRSTTRSKEVTHERIVEVGARAIRRCGYDGIGIADIMKEAGLTHGGFYAHFASREAMLAELADRAGAEAIATFLHFTAAVPAEQSLQALLHAYLSKEHVKNPEVGCPIAALGTEMPRQAPVVRRAITRRIKEMIDMVSRQSADWGQPGAHMRALATAATMIGAVVLARAVDEEPLSRSLLEAALEHLAPAAD
ncbi:TetR/AcrR family transcriptional regulator [Paraburkholderia sp. CNPSo 3274]|uniref:TetR/AcrR family transcriptional regulator n=1 Tax=Paraburkholderia sp. CNPSo 3274 TaxID=2940932 RepID=UPI0020B70F8F|nr:TetR/AcrR family transcriptional regulator [Paraburkholderia sp. CNPSo 3274]MCP3713609.1 TetR/AcrR family transcriptional regulator [Paraburkholderia sp. CNPSo 3274]